METEQHFLFCITQKYPIDSVLDGKRIRDFEYIVKRATLQRHYRDGEEWKRIAIDFDPLGFNLCFVVSIKTLFSDTINKIEYIDYRPVAIFETENETNDFVKNAQPKNFLEKKEKFGEWIVSPTAVMQM